MRSSAALRAASSATSALLTKARERVGIPALGLGSWLSPPGEAGASVKHALRVANYKHFDCAPIYGNEKEIGDMAFSDLTAAEREKIWVTSKLWLTEQQPEDVRAACEATLRDLRLDYLDLYLIHWPVPLAKGCPGNGSSAKAAKEGIPNLRDQDFISDQVPLPATWAAMEQLVDAGLVKHIGLCNASIPKLKTLTDNSSVRIKPEVLQVELHPYLQQPTLMDFCAENDIAVTAFSSLGTPGSRQLFAGGKTPSEHGPMDDPVVVEIAKTHGKSPAQVLLRWAVQRGTVCIPKSTSPKRIEANGDCLDWQLSAEAMEQINSLDRHKRYLLGKFYCKPGETLAELWGDETPEPEAGRMM